MTETAPLDRPHDRPNDLIMLTKHHGLGNDFLIAVDPASAGSREPTSKDAKAWCDRHLGIGADGLILATPATDESSAGEPVRHWRMVLWNADGGRAEISGNGIRCLGQAIASHLNLDPSQDQDLVIETDAGTRPLTILAQDGAGDPRTSSVRAGMGKAVAGPAPSERWSEVDVAPTAQVGVDIGNPHLVAFVPELGSLDMATVGPVIEADYPSGLNVHLVEVLANDRLALRVWERGAGVTNACGSGACAAAWAAKNADLVTSPVTVEMPGGAATVELVDDELFLVGPAVRVGEVIIGG